MTLLSVLQDEMKSAMKARDQARLDALRLMVSSIKYAMVDSPDMGDDKVVEVLKKEAKKRRESIVAYKAGGRSEQADKEQYELNLIEEYLPKMMSEDEIKLRAVELLSGRAIDNVGLAIGLVMKEMKGQADGGVVSKIVKEMFNK